VTARSLADWLAWQEGLNPKGIELGLERVRRVWDALGAPPPAATVITVGGTNGKGSAVAYCDAILRAAGYRVGTYTSPHLQRYNERVHIDGAEVSDDDLCSAFAAIDAARGDTPLTYFEFGTLAALWLFARAGLDAAVLEVGLGGRLDAVNLIDADVSLVTSVDLDHQGWLGDDRETIGYEKAGIFRAARPAVCGDADPPARLVEHATAIGAELQLAGREFRAVHHGEQWDFESQAQTRRGLPLPTLRGSHQLANAACALAGLAAIAERLPVDQQAVRAGLLTAQLAGRMEVLPGDPVWLLDVGHNPHAAHALASTLADQFVAGRTYAVLAMLADKDPAGVVAALQGQVDHWLLAGLQDSRGMSGGQLRERLSADLPCAVFTDVPAALAHVRSLAGTGDRVVVLGSFHTVGEARQWLSLADGVASA
jgi:dihydrofolate synthase/folylpolyglutamate synthase